MFGTIAPRAVPLPTYALFAARDTMTIFFSFNLPARVSPWVEASGVRRPEVVAQLLAPAACQVFSTPLHLWGLDLYNRERRVAGGWGGRWKRVRGEWGRSALARMGRIVPAFGVGGVVNAGVRKWGAGVVEGR